MNFEPLKAGNHAEYLVAAVFQGEGFLVRTSVPLQVMNSGQDATDIDLLGIKFTKPFQPHRVICDCKDKQRSKPFERIFWVKGLAGFVAATETYVMLPKASWDIFDFARTGQVRVLTLEVLDEAISRIYGKGHAYGLANESFYETFYRQLMPLYKKEPDAANALYMSRSLYLTEDPYVSLNIGISELQKVAARLRVVEPSEQRFVLWRYIAADLVVATSLLLLYIASDTVGLSKQARERHIVDRLTYGDVSPRKARELFDLAKELALEAASKLSYATSARQVPQAYDLGEIEPPPYVSDVCGLVDRAVQSPELYYELPQLLDYLLFEQSIQLKGFSDEEYRKTFPSPFQQERLKVARNIFNFIKTTCGMNLNVFWPREPDNLPKSGSYEATNAITGTEPQATNSVIVSSKSDQNDSDNLGHHASKNDNSDNGPSTIIT